MPTLDDTGKQPIARPASLKDAAYGQIKNLLISGQLQHERLYSAQYFAAMLGVSRTPVREALLQLASEGFLVCLDVRGFKIREFTAKEIGDVFDTRALIEAHVLQRFVAAPPAADLRCLEQTLQTMRACAAAGDAHGFLEADREFHMVPVRRLGNLHLLAIMDNIRNHISVFGLKALARPGRYAEVIREHSAILAALRQQDRKKAVQALDHHLAATQRHLVGNGAAS